MVGQWASDPDLIAQAEFERKLVDGWNRKKRRAPVQVDERPSKVIVISDNENGMEG